MHMYNNGRKWTCCSVDRKETDIMSCWRIVLYIILNKIKWFISQLYSASNIWNFFKTHQNNPNCFQKTTVWLIYHYIRMLSRRASKGNLQYRSINIDIHVWIIKCKTMAEIEQRKTHWFLIQEQRILDTLLSMLEYIFYWKITYQRSIFDKRIIYILCKE